MGILIAICTLLLLGLVVLVVSAPLRRAERPRPAADGVEGTASGIRAGEQETIRRDELEAAREAKYREIRDAEMDYRTGKLSVEDYQTLDAELRAEALEILDSLQRLGEPGGQDGPRGDAG